jgi:DinB family protein
VKLIQPMPLAISVVATLFAADLDQAGRKALLDHLDRSASEFRDSLKGLTPEQWSYKPAADVWSIAECAEHIALSEDLLRDLVANKVLTGATSPERVAERKTNDDKVLKMITDRSFKAKAPEVLRPTGQFKTPEVTLEKFQASRDKTIALAKSRDDLREHAGPHPVFKELDAYQWLLYLSGHTMRHTAQIQEVKANAAYPKGK